MTKRELIVKLHENGAIWANSNYTKADLQKSYDEMMEAQQMTTEELKAKIEAMDADAENPEVTLEQFVAKVEEINNTTKKEDATMMNINEIKTTFTFEGRDYTEKTNGYCFVTENGKTRRIKAAELEQAFESYIEAHMTEETDRISEQEEQEATAQAEADKEAKELWAEKEQAELDAEPCKVEVENDLYKPAVLNEYGCVDCSECRVEHCVHRDCMRRNPRSEGGLAECPRLHVKVEEEVKDPEIEQIEAEIPGIEDAEAELERNIRKEKKAKKTRKSKDIAYEGYGVTLTAKQVDFLMNLKSTDQWDGFDTLFWTDVICDEIGGQFAGKPMTVGAMISTLCEKRIAERSKGNFIEPTTGRSRKSTYMAFTGLGEAIATELGLK